MKCGKIVFIVLIGYFSAWANGEENLPVPKELEKTARINPLLAQEAIKNPELKKQILSGELIVCITGGLDPLPLAEPNTVLTPEHGDEYVARFRKNCPKLTQYLESKKNGVKKPDNYPKDTDTEKWASEDYRPLADNPKEKKAWLAYFAKQLIVSSELVSRDCRGAKIIGLQLANSIAFHAQNYAKDDSLAALVCDEIIAPNLSLGGTSHSRGAALSELWGDCIRAYHATHQIDKYMKMCQWMIENHPSDDFGNEARFRLASVYEQQKKYALALSTLESVQGGRMTIPKIDQDRLRKLVSEKAAK